MSVTRNDVGVAYKGVEFPYKRGLTITEAPAKSMRRLGIPTLVYFLLCVTCTHHAP